MGTAYNVENVVLRYDRACTTVARRAHVIYPDKSQEWHSGYFSGCLRARYDEPSKPVETIGKSKEWAAGFWQAEFDCSLTGDHP